MRVLFGWLIEMTGYVGMIAKFKRSSRRIPGMPGFSRVLVTVDVSELECIVLGWLSFKSGGDLRSGLVYCGY